MLVPVGVNIVTFAVNPSQIIGLVKVGFAGSEFTVTVPVPISLVHELLFVIVTLYVPAFVVVKLFTFPGAVTPEGTVHVYVYVPTGVVIVAVCPSQIVGLVTVGFAGKAFTVVVVF